MTKAIRPPSGDHDGLASRRRLGPTERERVMFTACEPSARAT